VRQDGYLLELYRDARLPEYKISRKEAENPFILYKVLPQARTSIHAFVYVAVVRLQAIRHEFLFLRYFMK
jgi:hypothetical protein